MKSVIALLLALIADGTGGDAIKLRVGAAGLYTPGFLPAQVVCDDTTIVRVEDAGARFRITGLRVGATDCTFWSIAMRGIRRPLHITVVRR